MAVDGLPLVIPAGTVPIATVKVSLSSSSLSGGSRNVEVGKTVIGRNRDDGLAFIVVTVARRAVGVDDREGSWGVLRLRTDVDPDSNRIAFVATCRPNCRNLTVESSSLIVTVAVDRLPLVIPNGTVPIATVKVSLGLVFVVFGSRNVEGGKTGIGRNRDAGRGFCCSQC